MIKLKLKRIIIIILALTIVGCSRERKKDMKEMKTITYTMEDKVATYNELKDIYSILSKRVIRPAEGFLKYPYLIPSGFYSQMWDWDGFFMGNYFISKGRPEYLKYWALNLIHGMDERGYMSGCVTSLGPRPIFGDFSMKPFLAQGVVLASKALNDYQWAKEHYNSLKLANDYREKTQQDEKTGLFFWQIAMQSGADNNPAMNYFKEDTRSFLAPDVSTLQVREYEAMAILADKFGHSEDAEIFKNKANKLRGLINEILWSKEDQIYYTVDRETGEFYKRVSYSSFWPLVDKIPSEKDGKAMIERYLINDNHMKSDYGLRSLSKQDVDYNNKNVIIPFSNWQGPVWPIVNYIFAIGLKEYGYDKEVEWIAMNLSKQIIADYKKYDSLHESFSAEDGRPLAPDDTYVDKDGKFIGFVSWNLCIESLMQGVVENKWDLLEIK